MPFKSEFWTDEKESQLVELAALQKYTSAELATLLGCTRNMVIGKATRDKIPLLTSQQASAVTWHLRSAQQAAAKQLREQRAAEKRAAVIADGAVDPLSLNISPEAVGSGQCRYPHGDGAGILFCGLPIEHGGWYCAGHRARCHIAPIPRKR